MASQSKSRWADDEENEALEAQRKHEKEPRKKAKAEKQRKLGVQDTLRSQIAENATEDAAHAHEAINAESARPFKRRRLSSGPDASWKKLPPAKLLRFPTPEWGPCRHVDKFEKLNHIEEGSYGWVSRARETATGEIVALKKLKMDNATDGFPVTGLREIQTLMASRHINIVTLREVVMGDKLEE